MADRPPSQTAAARPFLGVATTTPVAFYLDGRLYLERMNVLAADGAGIITTATAKPGTVLPLAFRLSTAKQPIYCNAEVLGDMATSPAGFSLKAKVGTERFMKIASASLGDSATVMFRLSDIQAQADAQKEARAEAERLAAEGAAGAPAGAREASAEKMEGLSVRFVGLDEGGQAAVTRHIQMSRRLSESYAVRNGKVVEIGENERKTMTQLLAEEGGLSERALDW